jgi:hypothetical protein
VLETKPIWAVDEVTREKNAAGRKGGVQAVDTSGVVNSVDCL